jgi:hypothetical protein
MTKYDVAWRTDALRECWEQQLSPLECAEHIGVTRAMMYAIFRGREWKHIPRPEGFVYPFPGQVALHKAQAEWRVSVLVDYVRERMTIHEFAEHIGSRPRTAEYILRGYSWKDTPRPEGFQFPWPGQASRVA